MYVLVVAVLYGFRYVIDSHFAPSRLYAVSFAQALGLIFMFANYLGFKFSVMMFLFNSEKSINCNPSFLHVFLHLFIVKDKEPTKSTVIGQPILLALEDADGAPSFLEKALKFVEEHGGFLF